MAGGNTFERWVIRRRAEGDYLCSDFDPFNINYWLSPEPFFLNKKQIGEITADFECCAEELEELGGKEGFAVVPVTITFSETEV